MKHRISLTAAGILTFLSATALAAAPKKKPARPHGLPGANLRSPVLWASECASPEGLTLSFGGQDQTADDGRPHTRIKVGGAWQRIAAQLRAANPLQKLHGRAWAVRGQVKDVAARARFIYFQGAPAGTQAKALKAAATGLLEAATEALSGLSAELKRLSQTGGGLEAYPRGQAAFALRHLAAAEGLIRPAAASLAKGASAEVVKALWRGQVHLAQAAEALDAEPPARALSPIAFDAKSKLFVLFGGDHLDYLTNDTWVFDPAQKAWRQRHPKIAPPPRANHKLAAADGKVTLAGGYTYFNDIWYCGGPYVDLGDGPWTYDVAGDAWTGPSGSAGAAPDSRTYRRKEFHPDFFLAGARPDAAAFGARLDSLPPNTWVLTKPPHRPKMNRDWGTAVIDPDHDVMLRWSGGHSAHGGSDVCMFHFATNRWELPFAIELPLGQTYSNTSYPAGFNFNRRPWVTGHTYKSYAFDPASRRMVFVGRHRSFYLYDPAVGDWVGRGAKPAGMVYGGCFYDLLCKRTAGGVACWTKQGELFAYDGGARKFQRLKVAGEKLPGSSVDSAGIDYDAKRDRLLLFNAYYGRKPYSGQVFGVDLKTLKAARLNPGGMAGCAAMPKLLRETCYVAPFDLVLTGVTMPPGDDGVRWTPAYDCAANKWVVLKISGPSPAGKRGRNVSMGLMYDARRKLIWAVDTHGNIFVLRLDAKSVERKDL